MLYIGALAVLAVLLVFAFNNRFLGQEYYAQRVGKRTAHWAGVAIQLGFVAVMTFLYLEWLRSDYTRADLWTVGILWAVLAEACELSVSRWVHKRQWEAVLAEYNPLTGHGWWLVPLAYLLAPVLVHDWTAHV